jgi:hypothetical protein
LKGGENDISKLRKEKQQGILFREKLTEEGGRETTL